MIIKKVSLIIMVLLIFTSCKVESKKEMLLGNWKLSSLSHPDKNAKNISQGDEKIFLKITVDSIFLYEESYNDSPDQCTWKHTNDSIYLMNNNYVFMGYRIIRLDEKVLEVENKTYLSYSNGETLESHTVEQYEKTD